MYGDQSEEHGTDRRSPDPPDADSVSDHLPGRGVRHRPIVSQQRRPRLAVASTWLIGFGIGTALLAAVFGLIDYMGDDRIRRLGVAIQHMLANVTAVVVSIINFVVRMDDPTDVGSLGVYLSGASC